MKIINLTPHTLNIQDTEGNMHEYPSDGFARAAEIREPVHMRGPFQVETVTYGSATGLPEEQEDTIYIVSALTAQAPECQKRADVYVPGKLIRDEQGRPVGCIGLAKI